MSQQPQPHFLLLTYPAQGHINPSLHFAHRLLRIGARVTFLTTVSGRRLMPDNPTLDGMSIASFSDGYDDGCNCRGQDVKHFLSEMRSRGSQTLTEMIVAGEKEGRPFTCLVYTLLLPWAWDVARELHLPSALLWIQPALVLDIYLYYFNGYSDMIKEKAKDPLSLIELPGLPSLTSRDLPSFLGSSNPYDEALKLFEEQIEKINDENNVTVLVNTFDALEHDALRAINHKVNMISVGPLIPSAFWDGKDQTDTTIRGDLFQDNNYMEWLNTKPESSVVYVSFGSMAVLEERQMEEVGRGLIDSGYPFLWVITKTQKKGEDKVRVSCMEDLEKRGKIVAWCSQMEVLLHKSIGCFVTHCGWNSTLESMACGVPVVAFPQWTDQGTNAMLMEKVWKIGVRVGVKEEGGGIVEGGEIRRCLEMVMGGEEARENKRDEMRENVKKWKDCALEAAKKGGSSDKNLKAFVAEVSTTTTSSQSVNSGLIEVGNEKSTLQNPKKLLDLWESTIDGPEQKPNTLNQRMYLRFLLLLRVIWEREAEGYAWRSKSEELRINLVQLPT